MTLPVGLQVNPAAAAGLQACSETEVGFQSLEADGRATFSEAEADCPPASKLGSVQITTPLLAEPLEGAVYQAAQGANPFGSLLALYVVAQAPKAGVRVKLAGDVSVNAATGQLTASFQQTPQLPFEEFAVRFFGGNGAALATTGCGSSTTGDLNRTVVEHARRRSVLRISGDLRCGRQAVPKPAAVCPTFQAGTSDNQAAASSPFTLTLSRSDGEQAFGAVTDDSCRLDCWGCSPRFHYVAKRQAQAGGCPASSQIGHVTVQAGRQRTGHAAEAGKPQDAVYLTGPYDGAPFGLSIVVPAEAGPFNLDEGGRPVIVRAAIRVDPDTAQVSVESGPIPSRLQGIPLDVKTIAVAIDREGFMLNPTNCGAMAITGTLTSAQGASDGVSSHFQAANCAGLSFKPSFTASTHGKASKADGAGLDVKVAYPAGAEANIRAVKVDLPDQLPSRLETLQRACLAKTFETNPAACPRESIVGIARASTPALPVALLVRRTSSRTAAQNSRTWSSCCRATA